MQSTQSPTTSNSSSTDSALHPCSDPPPVFSPQVRPLCTWIVALRRSRDDLLVFSLWLTVAGLPLIFILHRFFPNHIPFDLLLMMGIVAWAGWTVTCLLNWIKNELEDRVMTVMIRDAERHLSKNNEA